MPERPNLLSRIVKSRLDRANGMGLDGLAASSIGFVMLGCIAVGYFGGSWADKKMGTSWAMPAGTFLGMLGGFVEMFRTLKQIGKNTKWPSSKGEPSKGEPPKTNDGTTGTSVRTPGTAGTERDEASDEAPPVRQRLFHVPPPPLPEFESRSQKVEEPSAAEVAKRLHESTDAADERE